MKIIQMFFILIIFFSTKIFSHSGGTDSRGCHGGSETYHCHNGNTNSSTKETDGDDSFSAYDLNIGYQYHIEDTLFIPYAGLSLGNDEIGKDKHAFDEYDIGVNLGLKFQNGWYIDYTSTSKSTKLGYRFLHLSLNSNFLGFGFRFPFHHNSDSSNQSFIYFSGTGFK